MFTSILGIFSFFHVPLFHLFWFPILSIYLFTYLLPLFILLWIVKNNFLYNVKSDASPYLPFPTWYKMFFMASSFFKPESTY